MTHSVTYVYGIVAPPLDLAEAPPGLDGTPVTLVAEPGEGLGDVAALVTRLDAATYSEEHLERATADVAWLGSRAEEHDRVLTWASDHTAGRVAPLPMFSLFRDGDSVRAMLRGRAPALRRTLARLSAGREYQVRLHRIDQSLRESLTTFSPRIAALEAAAKRAAPGQRYLLERKLDLECRAEMRRVGQEVAQRVHAALASVALETTTDPLPRRGADVEGTLLSSTAVLVRHADIVELQRIVTTFVDELEGRGFHVAFTGPWPPYHFAGSAVADA